MRQSRRRPDLLANLPARAPLSALFSATTSCHRNSSRASVGALAWLQLNGQVDDTYWLILFTALFFALLMGLHPPWRGFGDRPDPLPRASAWRGTKAYWRGVPSRSPAGLLLTVLAACYTAQFVRAPGQVAAKFRDAASACQFGCITVALVAVSAGALPHTPRIALAVWALAAAGRFVLFLALFGRWIAEPTGMAHATPAWLIPIVGNTTATLAGVPLGFPELSGFFSPVPGVSLLKSSQLHRQRFSKPIQLGFSSLG